MLDGMGTGTHAPYLRARSRFVDITCCLALVGVAFALTARAWTGPVQWTTDGIEYQAKLFEARGASEHAAVQRAYAAAVASKTWPRTWSEPQLEKGMKWFRRRPLMPVIGAKLYPWLGARSLLVLSLGAFALLGPALYIFLRQRFSAPYAAGVAAITLAFPPLRDWSSHPLTDSAGVLLVVIALTAAVLTITKSRWWLLPWAAAVAAGSVTRETIAAVVLAAALLAVRGVPRSRALFATGVLAVAPAMLLLRFPFKAAFANVFHNQLDRHIDPSTWALIKWWPVLILRQFFGVFLFSPLSAAILFVGVLLLLDARRRERNVPSVVAWAGAIGGVLYLWSFPFFSGLRLELVLTPAAAFGIALLAEDSVAKARTRTFFRRFISSPRPKADLEPGSAR